MRPIFFFFILVLPQIVFAQKYQQFYVTHENDTIECQILDFSNKRVYLIENGKRKSYSTKVVKSFSSLNMEKYKTYTTLKNDQKNFYEESIIGPLSLYKLYRPTMYGVKSSFILVKDNKIVELIGLNARTKIANFISDCPSLYKEWTETKKYKVATDKEMVIILYNLCIKEPETYRSINPN